MNKQRNDVTFKVFSAINELLFTFKILAIAFWELVSQIQEFYFP